MTHPSVAEIMALAAGEPVTAAVSAHVAGCAACRRLAGLGDPASARALVELVAVDPALYHGREPLPGGRGGMGTAMRAWDRRLGREIVIKQIGDAGADAATRARLRARLEHEARLTARLDHPGIVTVHELGRWPDGEPFYTMPLVTGEPLDRAIAARPTLPARLELLPRVAAMADAVAYAHDRGIVHRDLKPANVVLGPFGETVVIDWGLACALDERAASGSDGGAPYRGGAPDLTALGVGTPAYMPPEQARGAAPDPRADVHALGATLYHLLAGVPPYGDGDEAGADPRRRLLDGPPTPLATLAPGAPADLIAIVETAMARDPARRYPSAVPLADELRRLLAGQLTRTHRYRAGELVRHWLRRHRTAVRIGAVAAAAVVAVGAWSVARVVRERDAAEVARREAEARRREAEAALAVSNALHASLLAREPTRRLDAVALAAGAAAPALIADHAPPPELAQGLADALAAGPAATALATRDPVIAVTSPDDARVAIVERAGEVVVWDAVDGARVAALATPGALWARWSSPQQLVVWGLGPAVALVDLDGRRVELDAAGDGPLVAVDAARIVTVSRAGAARAWSADGVMTGRAAAGCHPAMIDAHAGLVVIACDEGVVAWRPGADAVVRLADGHRAGFVELDAAAATLVAVLDGHDVVRWDVADVDAALAGGPAPAPAPVLAVPEWVVYRAHLTPDGGALSISAGIHRFVEPATGAAYPTLIEPHVVARTRRWAGTWAGPAAAARLAPEVRDVALVLRGHRPYERASAAPALDGRRIACATGSGEAWLWDSRLGVDAGALPDHRTEIVGISVAGDQVVTASLDGTITATGLDGVIAGRTRAGSELLAWDAPARLGGTRGGEVIVVAADAAIARRLRHGATGVSAVASRADGAVAASGALDGSLVVWSLPDGAARARVPGDGDAIAAIAVLGDRVVTGHRSGALYVRDPDGAIVAAHALHEPVVRIAGDGDHHVVVATAGGAGVRVALAGGAPVAVPGAPVAGAGAAIVATLTGEVHARAGDGWTVRGAHALPVLAAAVAADGGAAWTADAGGTVRAWDLAAGAAGVIVAAGAPVTALALTPDGDWLIVGLASGAVRAWPARPRAARRRACATLREHRRPTPPGLCP